MGTVGAERPASTLTSWRAALVPPSVHDGRLHQGFELLTQAVGIRRRTLCHQDGDHSSRRIVPENCARRTVPAVLTEQRRGRIHEHVDVGETPTHRPAPGLEYRL